ncbi:L,D-transpeptidase family protein [Candidatus Pelagibacter sp.]|nr:L,D-transpeptidase family protein [Candidatus Pelagibacter sp.]|tara:strand:+ start:147 stop:641 length:495 start_codon:yes stop_codon:yes gene_type:complete
MTIIVKNKDTLTFGDFVFKCAIGKKGSTIKKKEGDMKTPKGIFEIGNLYYREDRLKKPSTSLKTNIIRKKMGWCNDVNYPKKYNKQIKINKKITHEKLNRKDSKYDLLIPIKYNFKKPKIGKGSAIFIHLTNNYRATAGCIALKKNDLLILLKLINRNTKIRIC